MAQGLLNGEIEAFGLSSRRIGLYTLGPYLVFVPLKVCKLWGCRPCGICMLVKQAKPKHFPKQKSMFLCSINDRCVMLPHAYATSSTNHMGQVPVSPC